MGPTGPKRGFWGGSAQKEVRRFGPNRLTWLVEYYGACNGTMLPLHGGQQKRATTVLYVKHGVSNNPVPT